MPKPTLVPHEVSMTPAQVRKLMKGATTLLKADQVIGKGTRIYLTPAKQKKLVRAGTKKKGFKLAMTPEELSASETSGGMVCPPRRGKALKTGIPTALALSGLDGKPDEKGGNIRRLGRQIRRGIQKAVSEVKEGVNDGLREYREKVRPVAGPALKAAVKTGIEMAAPAIVSALGAPQLAPVAAAAAKAVSDKAATELGKATGGWGMRRRGAARLQSNYSNFLNAQHPAMNPALPPHDNSLPMIGGSFRAIGARTYGGSVLGSPMTPMLPQGDNSVVRLHGRGFRAL